MMNTSAKKGWATPTPRMLRLVAALVALLTVLPCVVACNLFKKEVPHVDYVAQTTLDTTSESLKIEATVKSYIDGDTTHFYVSPSAVFRDGVVKA